MRPCGPGIDYDNGPDEVVSVGCLLLDARGVPMRRPMAPSQARREVHNGAAHYVHAEGVEPNPRYGTIQRHRPMEAPEPEHVVVLHADGVPLGWIQRAYARRYLREGYWQPVGELRRDGTPRTVILPELLSPEQLHELAQLEGWRAIRQSTTVAIVRHLLEQNAWRLPSDPQEAEQDALRWLQMVDGLDAGRPAAAMESEGCIAAMYGRAINDLMTLRQARLRATRRARPSQDADFAQVRQAFLGAEPK